MNPMQFLGSYISSLATDELIAQNMTIVFTISRNEKDWSISYSTKDSSQPQVNVLDVASGQQQESLQLSSSIPENISLQKFSTDLEFEEWLAQKREFEEYGKALTKAKKGVYVKPYVTREGKFIAAHIRKFPDFSKASEKSTELDANLKLTIK